MSLFMKPTIVIRPSGHLLRPVPRRSFSIATRCSLEAGKPHRASTALKNNVRESEEQSPVSVQVVGDEGKGAEGPHYQDQMTVKTMNPLTDMSRTGAWTLFNPIYTEAELNTVRIVHRPTVTIPDNLAHGTVRLLRRIFDFATGYKAIAIPDHVLATKPLPVKELRERGQLLSDKNWLLRIILLESIAGVPGMVGGTLRHLRSLRLLVCPIELQLRRMQLMSITKRRDGGWIHTLLEEAENERMHLLTFMTIFQPTLFTRAMVMAAQGVFYNAFFLMYLISPKTAHRFVGALEEEAVRTYTHCIEDIERGLVPEWQNVPAPRIAIDYWRLPQSSTLLDVIRAVRADEATHRFVNHSLADLDHKRDFNPFALAEASAEIRGTKYGFTREESAEFARISQQKLMMQAEEVVKDQKRIEQ